MFKKYHIIQLDSACMGIVIFALLSALCLGYIFYNSSQSGDVSNKKSGGIAKTIQKIIDPDKKIDEENFHEGVRKTAHFVEFSVLGVCLGGLFISIYYKYKKKYFSLPLLLSLLSAVTDEFIQTFTERTSKVTDVLVDFGGAATGLGTALLCLLAICFTRRKKQGC